MFFIIIKREQLSNYTCDLVFNPHNVHVDDVRNTKIVSKFADKNGNGYFCDVY